MTRAKSSMAFMNWSERMIDRYDNIAPTRPDRIRRKDIESFSRMASLEGSQTLSEIKVSEGLYLRKSFVTEEIFDFYFDAEDKTYRFNVRWIKNAIVKGEIPFAMFRATLTKEWYDIILQQAGIEEDRISEIKELNRPGLLVIWPDQSSVLIDGNHRLIARWRRGLRHFRYAAVALSDATPYIKWKKGKVEHG